MLKDRSTASATGDVGGSASHLLPLLQAPPSCSFPMAVVVAAAAVGVLLDPARYCLPSFPATNKNYEVNSI